VLAPPEADHLLAAISQQLAEQVAPGVQAGLSGRGRQQFGLLVHHNGKVGLALHEGAHYQMGIPCVSALGRSGLNLLPLHAALHQQVFKGECRRRTCTRFA